MTGRHDRAHEGWAATRLVLDRLRREAPGPVARGRALLEDALAWTGTSAWPEVAWTFSALGDGRPVEFVWRPGEPGLYWTAEPAAPEWDGARRLARAIELAERSGARYAAADRDLLSDAAAAAPGSWPVWVAGRHGAAGGRAKIYVLLGAAVPPAVERRLAPMGPALRGGDRRVMLGLEPDGALELYWRRDERQPGDAYRLAACAGDAAWHLDRALKDWTGRGLDDANGGHLGLSLRLSRDGRLAAAAFVRSRTVGAPELLRRRLLRAGGRRNPALGALWAARVLRPMLLTLGASEAGCRPALGFTLA